MDMGVDTVGGSNFMKLSKFSNSIRNVVENLLIFNFMKRYLFFMTMVSSIYHALLFFSPFPLWFISLSFFGALAIISFGNVVYKNPTFDDFNKLRLHPETNGQRIFPKIGYLWMFVMFVIMAELGA